MCEGVRVNVLQKGEEVDIKESLHRVFVGVLVWAVCAGWSRSRDVVEACKGQTVRRSCAYDIKMEEGGELVRTALSRYIQRQELHRVTDPCISMGAAPDQRPRRAGPIFFNVHS